MSNDHLLYRIRVKPSSTASQPAATPPRVNQLSSAGFLLMTAATGGRLIHLHVPAQTEAD
jgi:hypothetical protein